MNNTVSSVIHPDTPLGYAQSACGTMMRRYAAADLPPKGHFHYHQGVFLSGVYKTYQLCGNKAYFSYMKDWIDSVFTADGKIKNFYNHADLDDIQPGILLFPLLEKTGNEKYRKCIESVAAQLPDVPLCKCGGMYHKISFTGQMWLGWSVHGRPFCRRICSEVQSPGVVGLYDKRDLPDARPYPHSRDWTVAARMG